MMICLYCINTTIGRLLRRLGGSVTLVTARFWFCAPRLARTLSLDPGKGLCPLATPTAGCYPIGFPATGLSALSNPDHEVPHLLELRGV